MTTHRHAAPAAQMLQALAERAIAGAEPCDKEALALAEVSDLPALMAAAAAVRDHGRGRVVTFSRKVFIPLTRLCRDQCHYCTFAQGPVPGHAAYLSPDEVLAIARAGQAAGCDEALFTLGDQPERRWPQARRALAELGHASTLDYLHAMAHRVLEETGLLPHLNPGVMGAEDIARLRPASASMGLMLESASERLCGRGGPHLGSPDKQPALRLATIEAAGRAAVPFTSGILIGIGETRRERIESLLALRALHRRYGHLQEVIVQNFVPHPGTRMAEHSEASLADHLWSIAVARLVFGMRTAIQAPPNLRGDHLGQLLAAGVDDWGGVSPVTPDHVNPDQPWPTLQRLAVLTADAGHRLVPRLAAHAHHVRDAQTWFDPALRPHVWRRSDAQGLARPDDWTPGGAVAPQWPPQLESPPAAQPIAAPALVLPTAAQQALARCLQTGEPAAADIATLFAARGADALQVCAAADALRREANGDVVGYVVNRNITYTNVCGHRCQFCAFARGRRHESLRGPSYEFDLAEIVRRAVEAHGRGATEVCIQGGIHPGYDGGHYLDIVRAVKAAAPDVHVHAFSPQEVTQGARTLGLPVVEFLRSLRAAGLGSLPGTAAEILHDEVRRQICPDKIDTAQWLAVVEAAHEAGLPTTATIMFGHVEHAGHWAAHLLALRRLQARTGGFTEFVPLPFVAAETPMFRQGRSRSGPTLREAVLMHAVARIVLHRYIDHIQASWVKMGPQGMRICLGAGADDYGGTLMDESISRAAGAGHGQWLQPQAIESLIVDAGRIPVQRSTLYQPVRTVAASAAAPRIVSLIEHA